MSQQDQTDEIIVNHKVLKQVADELLPPSLFRGIDSRSEANWKPRMVVLTVLFMLTSGKKTLSAGFPLGRKAVDKIFRWHRSPGTSYQGFVTQLSKWHFELKLAVMIHLQGEMQDRLSDEWTMHGFVVMACDGSRVELSRTASLENAYSPKKKTSSATKKKSKPSRGKGKKKVKRKAKKKQPPLELRLIELHDGRQPVYLVTNLPKSRLSDRHACEIYAARWGIELFFRTFKQTFGCRKLRSQAAANVAVLNEAVSPTSGII